MGDRTPAPDQVASLPKQAASHLLLPNTVQLLTQEQGDVVLRVMLRFQMVQGY